MVTFSHSYEIMHLVHVCDLVPYNMQLKSFVTWQSAYPLFIDVRA